MSARRAISSTHCAVLIYYQLNLLALCVVGVSQPDSVPRAVAPAVLSQNETSLHIKPPTQPTVCCYTMALIASQVSHHEAFINHLLAGGWTSRCAGWGRRGAWHAGSTLCQDLEGGRGETYPTVHKA
jgi:hypothetical protein